MTPVVAAKKLSKFDPKTFLSTINGGRKIEAFPKKQTIFVQGDPSDAVFYLQKGKVRLTVVSGGPQPVTADSQWTNVIGHERSPRSDRLLARLT